MEEYAQIILRIVIVFLGAALTLGVTLLCLMVRRMYASIDLLFKKYDALKTDVDRMKIALVAVDPSKTVMLKAFIGDGKD